MSTDFCEECTREAIEKYGWPDVFNTDQGCQYTSKQFTRMFNWEGCPARLSMDGKGRAYDNIFVERFWRALKYEDGYLKGYTGPSRSAERDWVRSLDGNTPSDIYFGKVRLEGAA